MEVINMDISKEEKESLYQEFAKRFAEESGITSKTLAYRNLHNLERSREHFRQRYDSIMAPYRKTYEPDPIIVGWDDWNNRIIRLVCHAYGVTQCGQIEDDELEMANDFAIKLIDEIFDEHVKHLKFKGLQQ